jgi:hypothetical protein
MKQLSRRAALISAAFIPAVAAAETVKADSTLLALGRRFDALASELDHATEHGPNIAWNKLEEFSRIETQIVATPATTIEGFCVKARAVCWALLGDLDASDRSTADERMALSIVRDLIRICDPSLEDPGALKELFRSTNLGSSYG